MSDNFYQHSYGKIIIDDPEVEGFYDLQFTSMTYTLQDSIEVNGDTITEVKLVCDAKYMSPSRENFVGTFTHNLDQYIPQFLSRNINNRVEC